MSTFGFVFTLHYFALLSHSLEMLRNFGYAVASGGVFAIMGISLNKNLAKYRGGVLP